MATNEAKLVRAVEDNSIPQLPIFHGERNRKVFSPNFDDNLLSIWNSKARQEGIFRYVMDLRSSKFQWLPCTPPSPSSPRSANSLQGHFLVHLLEERGTMKRKPAPLARRTTLQKFEETNFHFMKMRPEEVLFSLPSIKELPGLHLVAVNASPAGEGHCLLIPDANSKRPQVLFEEGLTVALCFASCSKKSNFRVGFNSVGGHSSVNHLHFQGYYTPEEHLKTPHIPSSSQRSLSIDQMRLEFLFEKIFVRINEGKLTNSQLNVFVSKSTNYPVPCLEFRLNENQLLSSYKKAKLNNNQQQTSIENALSLSELQILSNSVMNFVRILQKKDIAHNIYICLKPLSLNHHHQRRNSRSSLSSMMVPHVYVFPRQSRFEPKDDVPFHAAFIEFAGHLVIPSYHGFHEMTAQSALETLTSEACSVELMEDLINELSKL